jgi:hypothetical protein
VALAVIIIWYIGIGVLAALGTVAISKAWFSVKGEQIFFGVVLAPIAAMYLAFASFFGATGTWRLEATAVVLFAVVGVLGIRIPVFLMLGYALHGAWDLVHEAVHAGSSLAGTRNLTAIPLAYGAFCAAYDWCMACYFYGRRDQWKAAWKTQG